MSRAGWRSHVICRKYERTWDISYPDTVTIDRVAPEGRTGLREYLAFILYALARTDRNAQIVVGHDMYGMVAARLVAWSRRIPMVYHCHDFVPWSQVSSQRARVVKLLEQLLARTAGAVIVPDPDRAQVVAQDLRLRRPPLVAANAPLCRPHVQPEALTDVLRARGFSMERVLLRQGRIGPGHAIEATLRSMPSWNSRTWGFVAMGHGDGPYLQNVLSIAEGLGLKERFAIVPPVPYDDVLHYTVGADAGNALYEPVHINNVHITLASNKLMEYLAAGLPALVSDTPAMRRFIDRYQCGIVADEKDPRSIAAAVNILLGDQARSRVMGDNGRAAFESELCYDRQLRPVLERMVSLVDRHGARS